MANYSDQTFLNQIIDASALNGDKLAIITAQWNWEVTSKMKEGALKAFSDCQISSKIHTWDVPGSYELIYAAEKLATLGYKGIVCLGVVVQGETRHFDFICDAVANGLSNVTTKHSIPVAFGVLTTDNMQQAIERAGGKHGNKGYEAAMSVIHSLAHDFNS